MHKDVKEALCKPLCLLIYVVEHLFLSDSIQQLLQKHRFHFLEHKLVLLTKYALRLKRKKIEGILNREAMSAFYFFIVIMKRSNFPYVLHKQIL